MYSIHRKLRKSWEKWRFRDFGEIQGVLPQEPMQILLLIFLYAQSNGTIPSF
jgi:hypothetical protein